MCLGGIIQAEVGKLVYGAYDFEAGGINGHITQLPKWLEVYGGIQEESCKKLLRDFFMERRNH